MNLSWAPSRSGASESTSIASRPSNMVLRPSTIAAFGLLPPPPSNMTPFYLSRRTNVRSLEGIYRGFHGLSAGYARCPVILDGDQVSDQRLDPAPDLVADR